MASFRISWWKSAARTWRSRSQPCRNIRPTQISITSIPTSSGLRWCGTVPLLSVPSPRGLTSCASWLTSGHKSRRAGDGKADNPSSARSVPYLYSACSSSHGDTSRQSRVGSSCHSSAWPIYSGTPMDKTSRTVAASSRIPAKSYTTWVSFVWRGALAASSGSWRSAGSTGGGPYPGISSSRPWSSRQRARSATWSS